MLVEETELNKTLLKMNSFRTIFFECFANIINYILNYLSLPS